MAGLSRRWFCCQRIGDGSQVAARIVSISCRGIADGNRYRSLSARSPSHRRALTACSTGSPPPKYGLTACGDSRFRCAAVLRIQIATGQKRNLVPGFRSQPAGRKRFNQLALHNMIIEFIQFSSIFRRTRRWRSSGLQFLGATRSYSYSEYKRGLVSRCRPRNRRRFRRVLREHRYYVASG
jgi:hypothetical protein